MLKVVDVKKDLGIICFLIRGGYTTKRELNITEFSEWQKKRYLTHVIRLNEYEYDGDKRGPTKTFLQTLLDTEKTPVRKSGNEKRRLVAAQRRC